MAALTGIELCAGVGMLGEGVRAAFRFLGHEYRAVAYVEREAYAAAQLVALMESECLDAAPIWSDMLTFDGKPFRGKVDCIIAGFPCQDLSIAGRRAGLDGKRSGLFFRVCDIADDCQARILILENVSAIASATATATVMDEAEELDERAAARVMGELADRGWDAEWITLSASEVGASHRRARWFCFAWRMADTERAERGQERIAGSSGRQGHDGSRQAHGGVGVAEQTLGHTRLQHQQLQQWEVRPEHPAAGSDVADAQGERGGRRAANPSESPRRPSPEIGGKRLANTIIPRPQIRSGGGAATMSHFNRSSGPTLSAFVTHSESSPQAQIAQNGPESSNDSPSSPRRLNPAFAAWLMGIPWWWTNPELTSSAQSEMGSYRCKLQQHLSCFFDERESGLNREVA